MKEKTKEYIIKGILIIGLIGFLLMMIIIFLAMFVDEENSRILGILLYCGLAMLCGSGLLYMIIVLLGGGLKIKPTKAEKISIQFSEEQEVDEKINTKLEDNKREVLKENQDLKVILYTKNGLGSIECYIYIKVKEAKQKEIDNIKKEVIEKIAKDNHLLGREKMLRIIEFISMDRITPDFEKMVNSNIMQQYNIYHLPCGISWEDKTLYVAKQKDGFAIAQYKKLRKRLFKILDINLNKK